MEQDLAFRLKTKVEELIARCERLSGENDGLRTALARCEEDNRKKNEKIKEQEKQLDSLRLKEAFLGSSADRLQARRKIAGLMKEIDECVNLLNEK
ncbi:MAG: hypothetical protein K6G79_03705 [Bacteroidales bacterium]|nr:hypothetical protein [Bacteroidales bacterium]